MHDHDRIQATFRAAEAASRANTRHDPAAYFGAFEGARDALLPFAKFTPGAYTRNQLAENADTVLVLICWDSVASCIHGHGVNCSFFVLEGEVTERRFSINGDGKAVQAALSVHGRGAIVDSSHECIHQVAASGRAVTLHRYHPVLRPEDMPVYGEEVN